MSDHGPYSDLDWIWRHFHLASSVTGLCLVRQSDARKAGWGASIYNDRIAPWQPDPARQGTWMSSSKLPLRLTMPDPAEFECNRPAR